MVPYNNISFGDVFAADSNRAGICYVVIDKVCGRVMVQCWAGKTWKPWNLLLTVDNWRLAKRIFAVKDHK